MTDISEKVTSGSRAGQRVYELGFFGQLRMMGAAFWESGVRNRTLVLLAALLTVILSTVYTQVLLNEWNAPFYNALEKRDLGEFFRQLEVFALIAATLLVLNVVQTWLNQMTALNMRDGLTRDLLDQWLKPGRAIRFSGSGAIATNPDQRLHEDARNLAESTTALAIGLVNATILLLSFIGVLWALSSGFSFRIADHLISIPGYMVWAALLYAGSVAVLSNIVGHRLVGLNSERYGREAQLRFSLMRANENMLAITLAGGEANERRRIDADVVSVLGIIRGIAGALTRLTWVSAGSGWVNVVAPILIAAPVYFAGGLSFGELMMSVGAFNQVNTALRWYVENFGAIAGWKATLLRVSAFRNALLHMDDDDSDERDGASRLVTQVSQADVFVFDNVEVCSEAGGGRDALRFAIAEQHAEVPAGARVMINGDAGANRHLLFFAMAGLWPWGSGRIGMPPRERTLFVPQHGYLPEASLREIVAFPSAPDFFTDAMYEQALTRCGLQRLVSRLDEVTRWDRKLDLDDLASLRIANIVLIAPPHVVIEDLLDGLQPSTQEVLVQVLAGLEGTTIVYVGRSEAVLQGLEPLVLHLRVSAKENGAGEGRA